jgi:hypothetical protein
MAQTVSILLGDEDRKRLEAIASDRSRPLNNCGGILPSLNTDSVAAELAFVSVLSLAVAGFSFYLGRQAVLRLKEYFQAEEKGRLLCAF